MHHPSDILIHIEVITLPNAYIIWLLKSRACYVYTDSIMCYTWSHGALNKLYVCDLFGWCSEVNMSWILCCIVLAYLWNKFEKYYQWWCYLHFIICHIYKSKDAVDNNFRWVELQSVWHAIVTIFHLFLSIDKLPQKNRRLHL